MKANFFLSGNVQFKMDRQSLFHLEESNSKDYEFVYFVFGEKVWRSWGNMTHTETVEILILCMENVCRKIYSLFENKGGKTKLA